MSTLNKVFGRLNDEGNLDLLFSDTGETVTRLYTDNVYPVNSRFSTRYEHSNGIVLTMEQVKDLGIEIE